MGYILIPVGGRLQKLKYEILNYLGSLIVTFSLGVRIIKNCFKLTVLENDGWLSCDRCMDEQELRNC